MQALNSTLVTKASGQQEAFDVQKLRHSLTNAGASEEVVERIISETEVALYPGMATKKIYRHAFDLLRKSAKPTAARYKLKQAIMELGPGGFPFERLVGALLQHQGYSVQVGQLLKGRCVQHEVDVVGERGAQSILVECKYHNQQDRISDVKVPLYIKARFDDIREAWERSPETGRSFHSGWIFTNTRFSGDALQYGSCVGLQLVSWDYPVKNNLRQLIDQSRLYPLTSLVSLSRAEAQRLLEKGLILCKELAGQQQLLESVGVAGRRHKEVFAEIEALCAGEDA